LPRPDPFRLSVPVLNRDDDDIARDIVFHAYDICDDHALIMSLLKITDHRERAICFSDLRKNYRIRREMHTWDIHLTPNSTDKEEQIQQITEAMQATHPSTP